MGDGKKECPSRGTTVKSQIDLAMDFALPHLLQDLKRILLSFGLKTILCVCHIQSRAEWSPMGWSTYSPFSYFFWLEIKGFFVSLGWRLAEDHDTEWFDSGYILTHCSWRLVSPLQKRVPLSSSLSVQLQAPINVIQQSCQSI